jgi:hypothetical protein
MFRSNNAKRATLAARDLFMSGRPGNGRPSRNAPSAHRLSEAGAVAHNGSRVRTTRLVAGALALGLLMMTPLVFGAAAYGTQGDCVKIEFHGQQPTTWVSDAHYSTVTVKAGQVTKTWTDVKPGDVIGPILRESNGKPIEFSHIVKCLAVETTTTTVPEEVTTTTVPEEVTTTTVPEEVTTTTVPDEETTTTVPDEVTTTTEPFAVPAEPVTPVEPTVPATPDAEQVRPIVNARTAAESLPFTGSQHLQLLGMIGLVALAAGFGMIQLVNRSR